MDCQVLISRQESVDEVSNLASEEFLAQIGIAGEWSPIADNCVHMCSKFRADLADTALIGRSTE